MGDYEPVSLRAHLTSQQFVTLRMGKKRNGEKATINWVFDVDAARSKLNKQSVRNLNQFN